MGIHVDIDVYICTHTHIYMFVAFLETHLRVGGCAVISRLPPSALWFGTGLGTGASYTGSQRMLVKVS